MGLLPISQASAAASARLSALRFLELTADIAGAMDFAGRLVVINPSLARLLETSPDDMVGCAATDIVHPEDRERFEAVAADLMTGARDVVEFELRFGSPDGGWRWFLTSIAIDRSAGLLYGIGKDVTERRENEERLRDAEERFRSAFQHASIGKAITSLDGRFLRVNRALAELVGRDQEQLTGMAAMDITHPGDREGDGEAMRRLAAGEIASYQTEKRYLTPGGAPVWIALSVAVVRSGDGAPQYFLAQMVAVGKRRTAERALAASERRFRALASASPAGIFAADQHGGMQYANDRLAEILGLGSDELDGCHWLRRIDAQDRRRLGEAARRACGAEDRATLEVRLRPGRAGARWVRIHLASAEVGDEVERRRQLIGTVDDVSARLQEREELTRREAEYRMLAEHSGDFLSRHAVDGTILYASPACESLLGHGPEHLVGRALDELGLVHEQDRAAVDALFAAALAGDQQHAKTGTYRIVRDDGEVRWVETAVRVVPRPDGPPRELVAVSRDVSARRAAERELAHRALHDPLTGLPNRALFLDRLSQALHRARRRHSTVAVLFCDLDRFKLVNDSLGHSAGDRLLCDVATRLREVLRPADTLARFGGDELTILCEDLDDAASAAPIAQRIAATFAMPFQLGDDEAYLQCSIGIAIAQRGECDGPEGLIRDADAAMYRAKAQGSSSIEVFDEAMRRNARERLTTESALRRALTRNELVLHYQPIVSMLDARIQGFEALVRWQHPERGLLQPGAFIPLAEDTALIVPLGEWVLREACVTAHRWHEELGLEWLQVNVNLSARHLGQRDLVTMVRDTLTETGMPADRLVLELTETAVMESGPHVIATLEGLKALGVGLALDDFGTGHSSLAHLHRFPLDILKIDRSLIAALTEPGHAASIAGAIVWLAESMGVETVAEGIESPAQRQAARGLGCTMAQGFLFARPAPGPEAIALLADAPLP